jgi:uncharacterized protein (DUF433 family)
LKIGRTGIEITDILKAIENGAGHDEILAKYQELTKQDISDVIRKVRVYVQQHMLIDAWLNYNFPQVEKRDFNKEWDTDGENELRNMFVNDISIDEISKLLNKNHWDILSKLKSLGLFKK